MQLTAEEGYTIAVRYSQARYPPKSINEFVIRKLNQLVVLD